MRRRLDKRYERDEYDGDDRWMNDTRSLRLFRKRDRFRTAQIDGVHIAFHSVE